MADPVGGSTSTIALTFKQIQDMDLVNKATFANPDDKLNFDLAVKYATTLRDKYGVDNLAIEIPKPTNAEQLGITGNKLKDADESTSLNITELFVLLHLLATAMKKAGKDVRAATSEAKVETVKAEGQQIRNAGKFALAAGLTGGIMQIGGGFMQGLGAIRAGNMASGATQELEAPTGKLDALKQKLFHMDADTSIGDRAGVNDDGSVRYDNAGNKTWSMEQVKAMSGHAERASGLWNASSQIIQGVANAVKAGLEYGSSEEQAKKSDLEAVATLLDYVLQNQDDIVKNMGDLQQDARSKLAEMEQANNATISKIWS